MNKSLLICMSLFWGMSYAYSQNSVLDMKINVNAKNSEVREILDQISFQTKYYFTYSPDIIPTTGLINQKFSQTSVREILNFVLNNNNTLNYNIVEDHIIICKKNDHSYFLNNANETDGYILLKGTVKDSQTKEPLPYVSVGIYNTTTGTVTNGNGDFNLKVPNRYLDSIFFTAHIGYSVALFPLKQLVNDNIEILLKEEPISIPEVIVKNHDPALLIKKAKENIKHNYPQQTYILKAFYREGVFKKKEISSFSEAVIDIIKTPYKTNVLSDKIYINKSRKIINTHQTDTVFVKLKDGLYTALQLDFIKNPLDFFDEENFKSYKYSMVDIVSYMDKEVYVIDFEQRETIKDALFIGKLFIDMETLAVTRAEFEINFNYNTQHLNFISKKSKGFTGKPLSVKYEINYKELNGLYILNRVRADLNFRVRKKNDLFSSEFHTFFEMIIINAEEKTDETFTKNNIAQKNSVFIDNNYSYDPDFWGKENFIKPEKDIEDAMNEINAKLQLMK